MTLRLVAALACLSLLLSGCVAGGGDDAAAGPAPLITVTTSTSPSRGDPGLSFVAFGDFGAGGRPEKAIAARMCHWRRGHPFDLAITTGDNVYPDGDPSDFNDHVFTPLACLLRHGVDLHVSLGNHDVETDNGRPEIHDGRFGIPAHNYILRDSGVRFVIADSNHLDRSWLRRALKPAPGDRWTIVVFHFPVYSPGNVHGSTPGYRPSLPRMFRRAGVDLVLNGHDHIYAVTHPLKKIRYVVTGGGGAELYGCSHKSYTDVCRAVHNFLFIHAGAAKITVRALPARGGPIDRFVTRGRS